MMPLMVTPIYAGLLALAFVLLSIRVVGARRRARVALGDGGDRMLLRRQRAHGNFAEYVPFALLLMALAELQGAPAPLLHGIGLGLVIGRAIHAYSLNRDPEPIKVRVVAMALTFTVLVTGATANLYLALS